MVRPQSCAVLGLEYLRQFGLAQLVRSEARLHVPITPLRLAVRNWIRAGRPGGAIHRFDHVVGRQIEHALRRCEACSAGSSKLRRGPAGTACRATMPTTWAPDCTSHPR